jgi:hypothetical protein
MMCNGDSPSLPLRLLFEADSSQLSRRKIMYRGSLYDIVEGCCIAEVVKGLRDGSGERDLCAIAARRPVFHRRRLGCTVI